MSYGDSKTATNSWQPGLVAMLSPSHVGTAANTNIAVSGATVASMRATVDADLLAATVVPDTILVNLGVNEMGALPAEATWRGDLEYILDAFHAKWPWAQAYVTLPWRRSADDDANTVAGWIATVVSARSGFAHIADDERVWLKGADDGAAMTYDGIHYSAAGNAEKATRMVTAMGY